MVNFIVNDMTCGHCENVVSRTIKSADPNAIVDINLGTRQVHVNSSLDTNALADVLNQAGYPASISSSESD